LMPTAIDPLGALCANDTLADGITAKPSTRAEASELRASTGKLQVVTCRIPRRQIWGPLPNSVWGTGTPPSSVCQRSVGSAT
jgi:hypothetical protein